MALQSSNNFCACSARSRGLTPRCSDISCSATPSATTCASSTTRALKPRSETSCACCSTIGQRVSAEGHIGCGLCQPCRTGNGHICEKVDILGIDTDGCFAEFVSVPEENIWPVHPDIPDHIAAIFDPLGNAMHTVMAAGVSGRSVLITGVGIIGLMAVTIARAAGAGQILVTDVSPRRLDLAKKLGADVSFDSKDDTWPAKARQLTQRFPADHPCHDVPLLARGGRF